MGGEKFSLNNSQEAQEAEKSLSEYNEDITEALEIMAELKEYDGIDVFGPEAIASSRRVEELSGRLKVLLEGVSAEDCKKYGFPCHPTDVKTGPAKKSLPVPNRPGYLNPDQNNHSAAHIE